MVSFTRGVRGTRVADRLDFEIDVELETGLITGHAGVPGLIEAFRQTGTAAVIDREIKLKHRKRGLSASEMVESDKYAFAVASICGHQCAPHRRLTGQSKRITNRQVGIISGHSRSISARAT